jgi:hypothetical protein
LDSPNDKQESTQSKGPETIPVPSAELERLYANTKALESLNAKIQEAEAAAKRAEAERLARDGEHKKALDLIQGESAAKLAKLTDKLVTTKRDQVVASSLMGVEWANEHAANQARALLMMEIEAVMGEDGDVIVRDKTGRPAADAIKEKALSEAFAHFRKPSTQGGSANNGQQAARSGHNGGPPAPLHKQIADRLKAQYGA